MRVSAVMLVALNFWRTREFNVFSRDAIERVRVVEMLREFVMRRPMRHREPRRGHSRNEGPCEGEERGEGGPAHIRRLHGAGGERQSARLRDEGREEFGNAVHIFFA